MLRANVSVAPGTSIVLTDWECTAGTSTTASVTRQSHTHVRSIVIITSQAFPYLATLFGGDSRRIFRFGGPKFQTKVGRRGRIRIAYIYQINSNTVNLHYGSNHSKKSQLKLSWLI